MQLFGLAEAAHFCSGFSALSGASEGSLRDFQSARLNRVGTRLGEGTPLFDEYRSCALRDSERRLFTAASHYRRSLDLMVASASPWSHVTLYYGAWHAAHALLSIFGCQIFARVVVDVQRRAPGRQTLRVREIGSGSNKEQTSYRGTHQKFWDIFYRSVAPLRPVVAPPFAAVLRPISGNPTWLSDNRNELNYDSRKGIQMVEDFGASFDQHSFPSSLPGALATQWSVTEGLLTLVADLGAQFGMATDALSVLGYSGCHRKAIAELVFHCKIPGLVRWTKKHALV